MTPNYPANCWYAAATADDITVEPMSRLILGVDVVLWRTPAGKAVALADRCAHRGFPLSHGTVRGDTLVCGYHGCVYDTSGTCIGVPSQRVVPTDMRVEAFPLVEVGPLVWIWPGNRGAASGVTPPEMPWLTDSRWHSSAGSDLMIANYLMAHEHYLDFSYAPVLHGAELPPGVGAIPAVDTIEVTETTVSYCRDIRAARLAEWEASATGLDPRRTYARRESGVFASPALHFQRWEIVADGAVFTNIRAHALTPETPESTRVHWFGSWNYTTADDAGAILHEFLETLWERDRTVLEMASARGGYNSWVDSVEFAADAAAIQARLIVAVMLAREAGPSALRPGVHAART